MSVRLIVLTEKTLFEKSISSSFKFKMVTITISRKFLNSHVKESRQDLTAQNVFLQLSNLTHKAMIQAIRGRVKPDPLIKYILVFLHSTSKRTVAYCRKAFPSHSQLSYRHLQQSLYFVSKCQKDTLHSTLARCLYMREMLKTVQSYQLYNSTQVCLIHSLYRTVQNSQNTISWKCFQALVKIRQLFCLGMFIWLLL